MKKIYVFGLILAFCFGVIGKTALDEIGYDAVTLARAEVAGMDRFDLLHDWDFKNAVEEIVEEIVEQCYVNTYDNTGSFRDSHSHPGFITC